LRFARTIDNSKKRGRIDLAVSPLHCFLHGSGAIEMTLRLASVCTCCFVLCLLTGCGGPEADPGVTVTGSVSQGGAGQAGVTVGFITKNQGKGGMSKAALTDASGKFEVKLLPGSYAVTLSKKVDASGNVPPPDADVTMMEVDGQLTETLPQYASPDSTPLSADVPAAGGELQPFVIEG
jgi:hypothetical protein